MATHAGRNATFRITAAVDFFSQRDEFRVGHARGYGLARVVSAQVLPILLRQTTRHRLHGRIVALAIRKIGQLFNDIGFVLPGQFRPLGEVTVTINAVATRAYGCLGFAGDRVADRLRALP